MEKGHPGRALTLLPPCDVPVREPAEAMKRKEVLHLPEVAETELSRHYSKLARRSYGVNNGMYPLGSCTMKYNPKINEILAKLPGFTGIHPLQNPSTVQGALQVMKRLEHYLCEINGMDAFTLQPAAGAHGEFTGLLLFKAYHESRGDKKRTKIIVPDSAHGTNPASAAMCGYEVVSVASDAQGLVDIEELRAKAGPDTAGLMLTNPNTLGLFDPHIQEITEIIHQAGGLNYYDGANLNAVICLARAGDMGFDAVHVNLHKTFSTPHGGGGPGSGPVGCKAPLAKFLPGVRIEGDEGSLRFSKSSASVGSVKAFYGNFLVYLRALAYMMMLGEEGLREVAENAVLNANYLRIKLKDTYHLPYDTTCMHEFVLSLTDLQKEEGVRAIDVAKALLDYGIHPPTMYFPLIVEEALMFEPTETEGKESLDRLIEALLAIYKTAKIQPEALHEAPRTTPVGRPDEVGAARNPVLCCEW